MPRRHGDGAWLNALRGARTGFPTGLKVSEAGADSFVMATSHAEVERWRRQALCAGHPDQGAWFAEDGAAAQRAKAVCRACPVRSECLAFAVATGPYDGIWGGTTPYERRRLRRQMAKSS